MEGLVLIAVLSVAALFFLGLLWAVASLVCWVLVLPFKVLGLVFKALGFLLTLPVLVIAGVIAVSVFGLGALSFLLPALPIVLLVMVIVWLARRGRASAVSTAR